MHFLPYKMQSKDCISLSMFILLFPKLIIWSDPLILFPNPLRRVLQHLQLLRPQTHPDITLHPLVANHKRHPHSGPTPFSQIFLIAAAPL